MILAPTTDARNVIQPTAATVVPLTLKGAAAQSDDLLLVTTSADVALAKIDSAGDVHTRDYLKSTSAPTNYILLSNAIRLYVGGVESLRHDGTTCIIGGTVIVGGSGLSSGLSLSTMGSSAHGMTFKDGAGINAPFRLLRLLDSADVELGGFTRQGYCFTKKVAAPADAELDASMLALWFDDTNGAGKAMFKGKTANGTVVTGSVALA